MSLQILDFRSLDLVDCWSDSDTDSNAKTNHFVFLICVESSKLWSHLRVSLGSPDISSLDLFDVIVEISVCFSWQIYRERKRNEWCKENSVENCNFQNKTKTGCNWKCTHDNNKFTEKQVLHYNEILSRSRTWTFYQYLFYIIKLLLFNISYF